MNLLISNKEYEVLQNALALFQGTYNTFSLPLMKYMHNAKTLSSLEAFDELPEEKDFIIGKAITVIITNTTNGLRWEAIIKKTTNTYSVYLNLNVDEIEVEEEDGIEPDENFSTYKSLLAWWIKQ